MALLLTGCVDPNAIGLQSYGSITGRVYDATTQQPINGTVIISSTGCNNTIHTNSDGTFLLPQVAEGTQTLTAIASGYVTGSVQVAVTKGQTSQAGLIALQPAGH
jgi:hypothetical protein